MAIEYTLMVIVFRPALKLINVYVHACIGVYDQPGESIPVDTKHTSPRSSEGLA